MPAATPQNADLEALELSIAKYDEAIRLNPQNAHAYNKRGETYGQLGKYKRAIEDYDEAIRLNPQLASAFANRAVAYTYLGRDLEAQQDTKRGIELGLDRGILQSAIQKTQRNR